MLPRPTRRPKLAVWKFASCDGCQLSLLDCERELLDIAEAVEIADFAEATSARTEGPYDLSLVEGSISTPADAERIRQIRAESTTLVTIGACATAGGIQALRNGADVAEVASVVYAHPEYVATLATSTPVADHVEVDAELRGCPIDRGQLVELITAYVSGRPARIPTTSVCTECKASGVTCVMVAGGEPCLGPVTRSGCSALCPSYARGCFGCFGPAESAATTSLDRRFVDLGVDAATRRRLWRGVSGWSPAFRDAAERAAADEREERLP
ncbi:MAG: oxidoreductase [Actinomycetota bacterium]